MRCQQAFRHRQRHLGVIRKRPGRKPAGNHLSNKCIQWVGRSKFQRHPQCISANRTHCAPPDSILFNFIHAALPTLGQYL